MRDKKHVFKRGLSLFLALTMCLSLLQVTAFAAEGEKHSYDGHCAECQKPGSFHHDVHLYSGDLYCKCCGARYVAGVGYAGDPICKEHGNHRWSSVAPQAATCTKPGHEAGRTCTFCGKVEGQL